MSANFTPNTPEALTDLAQQPQTQTQDTGGDEDEEILPEEDDNDGDPDENGGN